MNVYNAGGTVIDTATEKALTTPAISGMSVAVRWTWPMCGSHPPLSVDLGSFSLVHLTTLACLDLTTFVATMGSE